MSHPILVTGAAGGTQGSTGRRIASSLMEPGMQVRALVHEAGTRSDGLRKQGAEVIEGDLQNPASVQAAMQKMSGGASTPSPVLPSRRRCAAIAPFRRHQPCAGLAISR
jgi:uncharacterized protein YbjT (DUF2867 family)